MKRALALAVAAFLMATTSVAFAQSFWAQLGAMKGPIQPVKFPHDIHAGKLGMDCLYCHYGAEKSPVANLPPMSTCMGCHKIAVTDRPEVQKLTQFWESGKPVPWVPVYQLPEHVKFNHKRHVKAGIRCQDCHGPVEKMAVVYQYPSLKMGWCVTCHRERQNRADSQNPTIMDCLTCHH